MDFIGIIKNLINRKTASIIVTILCTITAIVVFCFSLNRVGILRASNVKINFNDGNPLMEKAVELAPGQSWTGRAFIKNEGNCPIYYRLYVKEFEGGLADSVNLRVMLDDCVLYDGKASNFTVKNAVISPDGLKVGEIKDVYIIASMSSGVENIESNALTFSLQVDAVQTNNNSNKVFG